MYVVGRIHSRLVSYQFLRERRVERVEADSPEEGSSEECILIMTIDIISKFQVLLHVEV